MNVPKRSQKLKSGKQRSSLGRTGLVVAPWRSRSESLSTGAYFNDYVSMYIQATSKTTGSPIFFISLWLALPWLISPHLTMHCLIIALFSILYLVSNTIATASCYDNQGALAPQFQPCNNNTAANSYASCCQLTGGDICLDSGLCLVSFSVAWDRLIWADACTDPTGRSGNCQQICTGRNASVYQLIPCPNGLWCCTAGNSGVDCCDAAFALTLGQVVQPSGSVASNSGQCSATSTATSTTSPSQQTCTTCSISSSSCPKNNTTAVGASLGAVLGVTLVAAIVAVCLLLRQIQKLKRAEATVPAHRIQNQSVGYVGRQEIDGNEFKPYRTELPVEGRW